jgi:outer membrane murein-binding lipoprotein Lpp
MWKKWTAIALLAALLLAGCGGGVNQPPGDQLSAAEDSVNAQAATLLNDAIAAFSDVLPAGLAPQATGTELPPLTLVYNGEETVLIGAPWRPPFPWPLPNGADDLNGKPLFITAKKFIGRNGQSIIRGGFGRLQKNARGEWEVAWYGERGAPPEVLPATVEQVGRFGRLRTQAAVLVLNSVFGSRRGTIIVKCSLCTPEDLRTAPRIHVTAPLPQNLPGREISSSADPDMQGFVNKLKDICCRKPKPFPPDWPPLILFRNDVSVVVVPYDNPRVREAQSLDDLIGQDIGFVYVRKKPFPGETTTDCGPNRVWCPPREEPFYNVRVIREREATFIQFTKLGNPSQVVATLPAEVVVEPSDGREIGIMDSIDSPNEPFLKIRWRKSELILRVGYIRSRSQ